MLAALQTPGNQTELHLKKAAGRPFNAGSLETDTTYVKRLTNYQIVAFSMLLISSFMNFFCGMYTSLILTASSAGIIIIAWVLLKKNQKVASYLLLLAAINTALVLITFFEGFRSGSSLFFFTSTLSFIFLINGISQRLTVVTLVVCFASYITTFLIAGENSATKQITDDNYQTNFAINLFLSFASTVWMAYYLARDNWEKQRSLKNQQAFLDTIFNTSMSAEIIMDMETGIVINNNTTSQKLFRSRETDKINGETVFKLFEETSNNNRYDTLKQKFKSGQSWEGELTCIRKDGTVFPGSVTIVQFWYNHKRYKKITVTDISEKKRMLQELQVAKQKAEESVEVKSRFLSQMSHELRTPLNGIIGTTNLLLQEEALPQQQEHLDILKFSSEHMLRLVNEVLDLSKLDAQKIKLEKIVMDFRQFIYHLSSSFKNQCLEKGLAFNITIDDIIKNDVVTDPTRLNQVLTNLLSNAIKFTHSGTITLDIKAKAIHSESQLIEFNVTDSGIGITEEQQKIIFEPFMQADIKTTRKYGGTGLGLNISKEIISLMGGQLMVESENNKGSRFYFTINMPVHFNYAAANAMAAQKTEQKQFNNVKVLIAEDNMINMKVATKFLDKWGVQYEKAFNGKQAVEMFNNGSFDVILMDLEMPEMDGYDALREIRQTNTDVPAIAFTAAVFQDMRLKLKQSGFSDYVQKPFSPDDLYKKLEKVTAVIQH